MNHRAAIRKLDEQPAAQRPAGQRVNHPPCPEDNKEWRRLLKGVTLEELGGPLSAQFIGSKWGPNPVSPWNKRQFVVKGNFIIWFGDRTGKSLGCNYIKNCSVKYDVKSRRKCICLSSITPRRPNEKWKDMILTGTDADLHNWMNLFQKFTPSLTIGEPSALESLVMVTQDSSGNSTLGLQGLPPIWEELLVAEGFTAQDFATHRKTLKMVVDFAIEQRESAASATSHINPKKLSSIGTVRNRPTLHELVQKKDPNDLYKDLKKIDAGSQGEVYRAVRKSDGVTVALKKIFIRKPEKEMPALENEIRIMAGSSHPNIINFHSCYQPKPDVLWISMAYMEGGKLTDLIGGSNPTYSDPEVAYVAGTLCNALMYLHERGLLHRDIKSDNVLWNNDGKLTLADFGFGADLTDGRRKRETVVGTPYWMAPEVIRGEAYDEKADIWSLGVLLLELIDGEPPNIHLSQMKALYAIISSPPPQPVSKRCDLCHSFLRCILLSAPSSRSSAKELLAHKFLASSVSPREFISLRKKKSVINSSTLGGTGGISQEL
eukprot:TRINITY_DN17411_c0_g1_i2.p1 TRINITY_DN17411_c0_g1~~TRINITY_DN17411_c0_g1_i2.p1  ORF type:complete len:554 (+),score=65.04 TRINITY_DN17411_c0_g1_i2:27-1664(+)